MNKILIVEDEEKLAQELKIFLENSGYLVSILANFTNTIEDIIKSNANLILLDINIPNLNGEIVCKELRKKISTPIIIVTSRNTELDELISINYGADDFLTKPYNPQILLARINRFFNRNNENNMLNYQNLILDVNKQAILKDNEIYDLTKNEFRIFYYLIKNKGKIVSRDDLMNYLWNTNLFIDDNTLTVNINRLRSKLESIGYKDIIKTKRSEGYILI